jgi:hypothetical protein
VGKVCQAGAEHQQRRTASAVQSALSEASAGTKNREIFKIHRENFAKYKGAGED